MKQKQILILSLIFAFFAGIIYSCKKQDASKLSVNDLIEKYDLKVVQAAVQDTTKTNMVFASAAEADAFIANIKNASYTTEIGSTISLNANKNLKASNKPSGLQISGKIMFEEEPDLVVEGKPKPGSRNVKYNASPISGYLVNVNWGSNYSNITTTGALFGFTLGTSFTQTGTGTSTYNSQTGLINFTVNGLQNYNIIVEGLGTIYSQPIVMTGSLNPTTGTSTMTVTNAQ
ncbi:hypothetical protein CA265_11790 [Sphingobacteriaceae bacterium GW460-11-11-14-LB5]|nr:hypothetical protein CA265_11790 [Sphingobacteriaceae bacterium GW460-11-11-14-LB5]